MPVNKESVKVVKKVNLCKVYKRMLKFCFGPFPWINKGRLDRINKTKVARRGPSN